MVMVSDEKLKPVAQKKKRRNNSKNVGYGIKAKDMVA